MKNRILIVGPDGEGTKGVARLPRISGPPETVRMKKALIGATGG